MSAEKDMAEVYIDSMSSERSETMVSKTGNALSWIGVAVAFVGAGIQTTLALTPNKIAIPSDYVAPDLTGYSAPLATSFLEHTGELVSLIGNPGMLTALGGFLLFAIGEHMHGRDKDPQVHPENL